MIDKQFITARVARMYRFCLVCVCVSVWVPKTGNFITTSHFAFIWWGGGPIQACPFFRLGPGLLAHLTDFVQLLINVKHLSLIHI